MQQDIKKIIEIGNAKISESGWKMYSDNIKYYGRFVRLFYQSKQLVETGYSSEDDDNMIYGIGIFLVDLNTMEFINVSNIEEIESIADKLNALKS